MCGRQEQLHTKSNSVITAASVTFLFNSICLKAALMDMFIHTVAQMCNVQVDACIVLTDVKLDKT